MDWFNLGQEPNTLEQKSLKLNKYAIYFYSSFQSQCSNANATKTTNFDLVQTHVGGSQRNLPITETVHSHFIIHLSFTTCNVLHILKKSSFGNDYCSIEKTVI